MSSFQFGSLRLPSSRLWEERSYTYVFYFTSSFQTMILIKEWTVRLGWKPIVKQLNYHFQYFVDKCCNFHIWRYDLLLLTQPIHIIHQPLANEAKSTISSSLSLHRDWKAKLIMLDFYVSGFWPYRVFLPVFISRFIFIPTHLWHAAWSQALLFTNNLSHLGAVNLHQFHLCLIVDRILGIFTPDEKSLKMKFSRWYVRVFLPDLCKMTGQTNSQLDPNLPLFQVSKGNECYISSD